MATEYLNEGAVTFEAAGWSGSGIADSNDYIVEYPFGPITAGLDQSSLTTGIESLYFKPGAVGIVGGGSNGPFIVDADASADAYVANYGNVTLYIQAGGGSSTINNFSCGSGSINYLQGGTFTEVSHDGGILTANASTIITTYYQSAGTSTIEYNATDATTIEVNGGTMELKRLPTTLNINAGRVILDADDAEDTSGKTINVKGGRLDWRFGAVPTVNLDGGTVDFSNNRRAFTPGSTAGNRSAACKIITHPDVDTSNITNRGAGKTSIGGATQLD